MTINEWQRRQELFHELNELPDAARRARLAEIAAEDAALGHDLEMLLDASADASVAESVGFAVDALLAGPDLEDGTVFDAYRITGFIGCGGMGSVYRAMRDDTGQEVAVKVLTVVGTSTVDFERFANEQRTLAQLNHPFIAHLYDADTFEDGTPWFAMEYVRGGLPITDYCRQHALPIEQRLRLFAAVCQAVQHAHVQAILHRDLKPSNIQVTEAGIVKLVDFGIAKHLHERGGSAPGDRRDIDGALLTVAAAAPEQLAGEPVGLYTDLYALGNVLYELLTDTRPFDVRDRRLSEIRAMVVHEQPVRPSARPHPPVRMPTRMQWRELDAICLKLLEKDPNRRYDTVTALLDDIDRFFRQEPVHAHSTSWQYRARKFVLRHAAAVAIAAALLLVIGILTTSYARRLAAERAATLAEAARTARLQQFIIGLFSGQEPDTGPAHDHRVRQLLERGAATAASLAADPDTRDELTQTIGAIFGELGDTERAESLLTESLARKRRRLAPDDPQVITAALALGFLRVDQTKFDEAERLANEALASAKRALSVDHRLAIRAGLLTGKVLTGRGEYQRAIEVLEDVARRTEAVPDSAERPLVLTELANAHQYAGHLDVADRLNRDALAADRRVHGDVHPDVADDLLNLAGTATTRGEYTDAERMDREALAIFERWYGPDHPETGSALMLLAQTLVPQGRLDEAAALLDRARDVFLRAYPDPHRRVGLIYNEIGVLATRRGRYAEAIDALTKSLAVYRQVYTNGRSQYISVGLANLGTAYLEQGDHQRAEALLREAVSLSTSVLTRNHANTAIAEVKLGRVLVRERRFEEALPVLEESYATLLKFSQPSSTWMQACLEALVTTYQALGRADDAARVQASILKK